MLRSRNARIRFSLLSFLLGTALICLSIVHWQLARKADDLEQTVWALREELGYLNVEDPKKVYVRHVESTEPNTWRYRVYLPPEREFRLNTRSGRGRQNTDAKRLIGSGSAMSSSELTGRFTMVISVLRDTQSGKPHLVVKAGGSSLGGALDERAGDWLLNRDFSEQISLLVKRDQVEHSPDEPVDILRLVRAGDDEMQEGVIVWFDTMEQERERQALREQAEAEIAKLPDARQLRGEGQFEQALDASQKELAIYIDLLGEDSQETIGKHREVGELYKLTGQADLAAAHLEKAFEHWPENANVLILLGQARLAQGRAEEAEELIRKCLAIRTERLPQHWLTANAKSNLGECLVAQERFTEAEPLLLEGYETMSTRKIAMGVFAQPRLTEATQRLVRLYEQWDNPEEAAKWRRTLEELGSATPSQTR